MTRNVVPIALAACALLGAACGQPTGDGFERIRTSVFPVFPSPFDAAETTELRTGFSWTSTEALPELDDEGNPALHYMILLVDSPKAADLLRLSGIYFDPMPLFPEELRAYRGDSGYVVFEGDEAGTFVFAIIPARSFNELRARALSGDTALIAAIARDVPVRDARLPSGALSYAYLGEHGFTGVGPHDPIGLEPSSDVASSTRLSDVLRRHVREVREALQPFIPSTVDGERTLELRARPYMTDTNRALFGTDGPPPPGNGFFADDRNLLTRVWGPRSARGKMLALEGAPVMVARGLGRFTAPLDANNFVRVGYGDRAVRAQNASLYLDLATRAGSVSRRGIFPDRVKLWDGRPSRDVSRLEIDVYYAPVQILAQATDVYRYAAEVVGAAPSPARIYDARRNTMGIRPGGATCLSGAPREIIEGTSTPNGDDEGWEAVLAELDGEDFSVPPDVVIDFGRAERHIPTYRYAQHLLCSLMQRNAGQLATWSPHLVSIEQGPSASHPGRIAMAAFAELITSQVAGATLHFYPDARVAFPAGNTGGTYCDAYAQNAYRIPCLDDNIGGAIGTFPLGQAANTVGDEDAFAIGRGTTIMSDFLDGHPASASGAPGNGTGWFGHWIDTARGPLQWLGQPPIDYTLPIDPHFEDDSLALDGNAIPAAVETAWEQSHAIGPDPWSAAFAQVALQRGASSEAVCELLATHTTSGMCSELVVLP